MTTNFPVQDVNSRAVYGSNRAASFIRDAMAGTDSLDVVVFGDSNAGSDGAQGYTLGWLNALSSVGIPMYATTMFMCSNVGSSNNRSGGSFGDFVKFNWTGDSQAGSTGTIYSLSNRVAASDAEAIGLSDFLGSSSFDIKPNAFEFDVQFLPDAATYTSPANGTGIAISSGHPLTEGTGAGGVELQYRVVYGKFPGGLSGNFRLRAMKSVNTLISGSASDISTDGGIAYGYATATQNFTTPLSSVESTRIVCSWDGYNAGGDWTPVGPAAMIWHSIIKRASKGYSVSNLNYYGGRTTTQLATTINNGGKVFESYLKELRERQIAAGGSGRVLWWHNSGINGTETGASFVAGVSSIIDKVLQTWGALGYPASDIAFVVSTTHPTNEGQTGDFGWSQRRGEVVKASVGWIQGNNGYASNGVTLVDIGALISAKQLSERNLFSIFQDAKYESHLRAGPSTAESITYFDGTSPTNGVRLYDTGFSSFPVINNNGYFVVCNLITQALLNNA